MSCILNGGQKYSSDNNFRQKLSHRAILLNQEECRRLCSRKQGQCLAFPTHTYNDCLRSDIFLDDEIKNGLLVLVKKNCETQMDLPII